MISLRYIVMLRAWTRTRQGAASPARCCRPRASIGSVVVEIEGISEPEIFTRLPHAIEELWDTLRQLPLGWTQYDAFRHFLGPGAVERVTDFLDRDGKLTLSCAMAGHTHLVRVALLPPARRPLRPSPAADSPPIGR